MIERKSTTIFMQKKDESGKNFIRFSDARKRSAPREKMQNVTNLYKGVDEGLSKHRHTIAGEPYAVRAEQFRCFIDFLSQNFIPRLSQSEHLFVTRDAARLAEPKPAKDVAERAKRH